MKAITAHVHAPVTASSPETPDPRPGNYYVSAIDGPAHYLPLDRVAPVRSYATAHGGPKAHFMAYGTVRMADDITRPGTANKYLPELLAA